LIVYVVLLGESYGGHYIPALGARIVAGNNNIQKGDVKIDLKGIAIGNGWVDPVPLALLFLLSFLPIFSPSILMWNSFATGDPIRLLRNLLESGGSPRHCVDHRLQRWRLPHLPRPHLWYRLLYISLILLAYNIVVLVNWFAALEECSLSMEAVLADAELQNGRTINVSHSYFLLFFFLFFSHSFFILNFL